MLTVCATLRVGRGRLIRLRPLTNHDETCPWTDRKRKEVVSMTEVKKMSFDPVRFLATEGPGRSILHNTARQVFYSQGDPADSVYYLQSGRAKLTVVSKKGKEATVTMLATGDFFGEESMAGVGALRKSSATAVSLCAVMKIEKARMLKVLHEEHAFSDFFMQFILTRGIRTQADLVDQL